MRLIVRCTECLRQYDVRDRAVGERIHCACGDVMVVELPHGHDAAVVRCSACGSPCTDDDRSCSHCGATLTVHERDLHTVCPGCLARISDRAAFCHGCGLRIVAESIESAPTEWPCPVCSDGDDAGQRRLRSRRFDDEVGGAECARCGGLFIEHKVFAHLEARARAAEPTAAEDDAPLPPGVAGAAAKTGTTASPGGVAPPGEGATAAGSPLTRQKGPIYRPCPVCGTLMHRQNYARKSAVIIDRCRDHGIWFDDDELERVLRFIRQGGARRAAAQAAEAAREEERRKRFDHRARAARGELEAYEPEPSPFFDILDALRWFFRTRRGLK